MSNFKLGKLAPKRLLSTPAFGDFLDKATTWPAVNPRGWEYAVPPDKLDILANDELGDCVIAAMMHYVQAETWNTSNPLTPTKQLTIETYSAITGYDPADDAGNNPIRPRNSLDGCTGVLEEAWHPALGLHRQGSHSPNSWLGIP